MGSAVIRTQGSGTVVGVVTVVRLVGRDGDVWLQHADGEGGVYPAGEVDEAMQRGPAALERYFWELF